MIVKLVAANSKTWSGLVRVSYAAQLTKYIRWVAIPDNYSERGLYQNPTAKSCVCDTRESIYLQPTDLAMKRVAFEKTKLTCQPARIWRIHPLFYNLSSPSSVDDSSAETLQHSSAFPVPAWTPHRTGWFPIPTVKYKRIGLCGIREDRSWRH